MEKYLTSDFVNIISDEEFYWDDPYMDYIDSIEAEGHSEMYFDFSDDDRPDWIY